MIKRFVDRHGMWIAMVLYAACMFGILASALPAHAQDTGYFAQKTYTSSGGATYAVPFPYLHQADLQVYDNGVAYTGTVTWTNSTTVSLSPVITTGHTVVLRRSTPSTSAIATYNGGQLSSTDLNRNQTQALYVSQEAWDRTAVGVAAGPAAAASAAAAATSATAASTSASAASTSASAAAASATAAATFTPSLYQTKAGITSGAASTAGQVGEVLSNTSGSVPLTSGSSTTVASQALTAGFWWVWGQACLVPDAGTTPSGMAASISPTNNTQAGSPDGGAFMQAFAAYGANQALCLPVGGKLLNLSAGQTTYLVVTGYFAGGTLNATAFVSAVRLF